MHHVDLFEIVPLLLFAVCRSVVHGGAAYPMAPIPLNDHSIQPGSAAVDQAYVDYAFLFNAMHGARGLLSARPATLSTTKP